MGNGSKLNTIHTSYLLDEARSPVARFRLLSDGVNDNARLICAAESHGDRACLACGNCMDNCPVVKQNVGPVFQQNQRTSMALENHVQEECRRCYNCVMSCPQVGKDLKEYAAGYRRVEKFVHLLAAFTIISLAATGVIHSHYGIALGGLEANVLKYAHRLLGILSIVVPILYYKLDIRHFKRTVDKAFKWDSSDLQWLKNTVAHISSEKNDARIYRNEFNPAQKIWYLFIMSLFPLLYISGLAGIFLSGFFKDTSLMHPKLFHMVFALSFDLMLFIHVYIKFIREWFKNGYLLYKNYKKTKIFVISKESCQ